MISLALTRSWTAGRNGLYIATLLLILFPQPYALLGQGVNPSISLEEEDISQLRREVGELRRKIDRPPKDFWDKLSSVSTLISGILVTLIGVYATQSYSRRQREKDEFFKAQEITVNQVQTVEKFFPYLLTDDENKRRAALEAIAATGHKDLAVKMAYIFSNSGGSVGTLSESVAKPLDLAGEISEIEKAAASLRKRVVRITSFIGGLGTGFVCTEWGLIVTLAYVIENLPKGLLKISAWDNSQVDGQVWLVDSERGLALLSSQEDSAVPPLHMRAAPIVPGEEVVAVGHSQEESFVQVIGRVSKYQILVPGKICIDMVCFGGFSGAPVVTRSGDLLGLISEYNPETKQCFLMPASLVLEAFVRERADRLAWEARKREEYMIKRKS